MTELVGLVILEVEILEKFMSKTNSKLTVFVPRERLEGETRVAATPATVKNMVAAGLRVLVETGAGAGSMITDKDFEKAGAEVVSGSASEAEDETAGGAAAEDEAAGGVAAESKAGAAEKKAETAAKTGGSGEKSGATKAAAKGYAAADIVLAVNPPSVRSEMGKCSAGETEAEAGKQTADRLKKGAIWISFWETKADGKDILRQAQDDKRQAQDDKRQAQDDKVLKKMTARGVKVFSMNLMPRISRAQKMDALSSQSNLAGYKAVVMAAEQLPKIFPLLMTAAGTINPAKVVVLGVGVAGLQAIATAKRLGAQVEASDIRPACKEQVESLGAKFIEVPVKAVKEDAEDAEETEDSKGYAKEVSKEFLRRQAEEVSKRVAQADIVITTALVPGKKPPVLVTEEMVKSMPEGGVIVDMAAQGGSKSTDGQPEGAAEADENDKKIVAEPDGEQAAEGCGNCELTEPGKTVVRHGVKIIGHMNLPALVPVHASQVYAKNVLNFLMEMMKDGKLVVDEEDEVVGETMIKTRNYRFSE